MIKSVHIQNVLSYKDTTINFHSGVNCIIGNSDAGKSALMASLLWPITNRPSGEDHCSWWGGDSSSTIKTESNTVERVRGKENLYILNGEEFRAFGQTVPDEIAEALNIQSINIQEQFDRHYLLADSPPDVARTLNQVANLEVIDTAHSNINKKVKQTNSLLSFEKAELKEAEKALTEFDFIEDMEADLTALQAMQKEIEDKKWLVAELENLIEQITLTENKISTFGDMAGADERVVELQKTQINILALDKQCDVLDALLYDIDVQQEVVTRAKKAIEVNEVQFKKLLPKKCQKCPLF